MSISQDVSKFNGEQFHTWQTKTMYLLMRKDLWGLVDGRDECPEGNRKDTWISKNEKALGLIALSLNDEIIHHIIGITEAKDAWDELNRLFGSQTKNSKIKLLMQFYKLELKENEPLTSHLNKYKSIKQQLATIGRNVEDDEAQAVLLKSIDKGGYENIVATLQNVPNMKLHEIEASLLEQESKIKEKGSNNIGGDEQALFTRGGFSSRGRGRGRGGRGGRYFTCNNCGKPGHMARDCYSKREEANFVEAPNKEEPSNELF